MSKCIVDIHGEIEGDYDIIDKSGEYVPMSVIEDIKEDIRNSKTVWTREALDGSNVVMNKIISVNDVEEIIDSHISGKEQE